MFEGILKLLEEEKAIRSEGKLVIENTAWPCSIRNNKEEEEEGEHVPKVGATIVDKAYREINWLG